MSNESSSAPPCEVRSLSEIVMVKNEDLNKQKASEENEKQLENSSGEGAGW